MIRSLLFGASTFAQLCRYTVVAGLGLVIDFGTVIIAKQLLGFHYLIATITGFLLGLVVTYILSNMVVFGYPKENKAKLFTLFGLIGLVGLGILSTLMWLFTGLLGVNYIVSKALATIVVFGWNFFARKSLYKDELEELPYEL